LLALIQQAVWPWFKISACLKSWNTIARDLAERSRRRLPRINTLC
jgi:hypothetical protein